MDSQSSTDSQQITDIEIEEIIIAPKTVTPCNQSRKRHLTFSSCTEDKRSCRDNNAREVELQHKIALLENTLSANKRHLETVLEEKRGQAATFHSLINYLMSTIRQQQSKLETTSNEVKECHTINSNTSITIETLKQSYDQSMSDIRIENNELRTQNEKLETMRTIDLQYIKRLQTENLKFSKENERLQAKEERLFALMTKDNKTVTTIDNTKPLVQ